MESEPHFGLRIKELINSKHLTTQTMADKLGMTTAAIYKIYDKRDLSTSLLRRFANILQLDMINFFTTNYISNTTLTQNGNFNVMSDNKIGLGMQELRVKELEFQVSSLTLQNETLREQMAHYKEMIEFFKNRDK